MVVTNLICTALAILGRHQHRLLALCVCVCVCERERERESDFKTGSILKLLKPEATGVELASEICSRILSKPIEENVSTSGTKGLLTHPTLYQFIFVFMYEPLRLNFFPRTKACGGLRPTRFVGINAKHVEV